MPIEKTENMLDVSREQSYYDGRYNDNTLNTLTPSIQKLSQTNDFDLSLIIPVHNEEKRLSRCLQRTLEYCDSKEWDYEIIIVEDGSTDGTVPLIKEFLKRHKQLSLISNKTKLGKGGAIRLGVGNAEKKYLCYMDSDLSADPSEIERLIPFIEEYDLVIGSRILRGKLPKIERPFLRSFLSRCYSLLFRLLFNGIGIYDPQCGFKLFKVDKAHRLLSHTETCGFAFDCEILVNASNLGLKIKEVPIIWRHDDRSKVSPFKEIIRMGRDLLSIWYKSKITHIDKNQTQG